MLSAARYPVMLFGSVHLPFILPHDALLYAILRRTHTALAYLLFLTILAHFGAILFHTLIVRDGMLLRMVPWNVRPREVVRGSDQPTPPSASGRPLAPAVPKD
jgi:cytochrome b561